MITRHAQYTTGAWSLSLTDPWAHCSAPLWTLPGRRTIDLSTYLTKGTSPIYDIHACLMNLGIPMIYRPSQRLQCLFGFEGKIRWILHYRGVFLEEIVYCKNQMESWRFFEGIRGALPISY